MTDNAGQEIDLEQLEKELKLLGGVFVGVVTYGPRVAKFVGRSFRRVWPDLDAEERELIGRDFGRLTAAVHAASRAAADEHSGESPGSRREAVLHPPTTALIAARLVQGLRDADSLTASELAKQEHSSVDDPEFVAALGLAIADGLITAPEVERRGITEPIDGQDQLAARTSAAILKDHPLVRTSGQVEDFHDLIIEEVHDSGALTLEELRERIEIEDTAETIAAFDAAVIDALSGGEIEWVPRSSRIDPPSLFHRKPAIGHPADPSLFAIPRDSVEREWPAPMTPGEAQQQLRAAWQSLRADLAKVRISSKQRRQNDGITGEVESEES